MANTIVLRHEKEYELVYRNTQKIATGTRLCIEITALEEVETALTGKYDCSGTLYTYHVQYNLTLKAKELFQPFLVDPEIQNRPKPIPQSQSFRSYSDSQKTRTFQKNYNHGDRRIACPDFGGVSNRNRSH